MPVNGGSMILFGVLIVANDHWLNFIETSIFVTRPPLSLIEALIFETDRSMNFI